MNTSKTYRVFGYVITIRKQEQYKVPALDRSAVAQAAQDVIAKPEYATLRAQAEAMRAARRER